MSIDEPREMNAYLEHLRALPFVLDARMELPATSSNPRADALIRLETPSGPVVLAVEHKRSHLTAVIADQAARVLQALEGPSILLAPHIGGPLGRLLAERGVNYVDKSGNCHLALGTSYVAHIAGRTQQRVPSGRGAGSAGYLVVYALLATPDLVKGTVREMAEAAGVSRQAVSGTLTRLSEQEILYRKGRGRAVGYMWSPQGRMQALDGWLRGYADLVRPKLVLGRFRTPGYEPEGLEALISDRLGSSGWLWGGASAGWRLDPWYRAPHTTIHLSTMTEDLRLAIRALPHAHGPLVVLAMPPPVACLGPQPRCVEPLLAYTEMQTTGGEREREAAQRLRERYLPWSVR